MAQHFLCFCFIESEVLPGGGTPGMGRKSVITPGFGLSRLPHAALSQGSNRPWIPVNSNQKMSPQDPGSWILDPGSRIPDPGSWILDPGSWIQDPGSWIQDPGSRIQDPGSRILDPGSRILDPRSWIQDPGSRIQDPS